MKGSLDASLESLRSKLAEREALHAKRVALQNLEHVVNTLSKIERLLGLNKAVTASNGGHSGVEDEEELSGDLVERVAADVNYLNFCVSKCEASAFVEEIKPRLKVYFRKNKILFRS